MTDLSSARRGLTAMWPDDHRRSLIELNIGLLLMGGTSLFPKAIDLPAAWITLGRSFFAAIALLAFLLVTHVPLRLKRRREYGRMFLLGSLLAVHWVMFFQSIQVSSVAIGVISVYTYPILVIILEPLILREPFHWRDLAVGFVVFVGIVILIPEFELGNATTQGVAWGVVSAVLFAIRNVLSRNSVRAYRGELVMWYQLVVVVIVLSPLLLWRNLLSEPDTWGQLALLGVMFTAVPHTLYLRSLNSLKAKTVGIVAALQPIYSIVLAALFLGEIPTLRTLIGGSIVMAAAVYEMMRRS